MAEANILQEELYTEYILHTQKFSNKSCLYFHKTILFQALCLSTSGCDGHSFPQMCHMSFKQNKRFVEFIRGITSVPESLCCTTKYYVM